MQGHIFRRLVIITALPVLCLAAARTGAEALEQPVAISQMGKDIDRDSVPDGSSLRTMGGDISLDHARGAATLYTMGGDVRVEDAVGALEVGTMGGDVRIGRAMGSLSLTTKGGDVIVHAAEGSVSADTAGGSVDLTLSPSRAPRTVTLKSLGGDLLVRVPHDFDGTIDATLDYTRDTTRPHRIDDAFGLPRTETPEWVAGFGTERKTIHVAGTVGHGRDHLILHTVNGNIVIQRA